MKFIGEVMALHSSLSRSPETWLLTEMCSVTVLVFVSFVCGSLFRFLILVCSLSQSLAPGVGGPSERQCISGKVDTSCQTANRDWRSDLATSLPGLSGSHESVLVNLGETVLRSCPD